MNASRKISPEIKSDLRSTLAAVVRAARAEQVPAVVVGAVARDLVFGQVYGVATGRATMDVDVAVRVASWEQYERLISSLVKDDTFEQVATFAHRLRSPESMLVDVVPFGELEDPPGRIAWPPNFDRVMSTVGLAEALQSALELEILAEPWTTIGVIVPAALAILKLVAWSEQYPERPGDARDFYFVMEHYGDVGNEARLLSLAGDVGDSVAFDYAVAGAQLLGRDMRTLAAADTIRMVAKILTDEIGEQSRNRLVTDIVRERTDRQRAIREADRLLVAVHDALTRI